MGDTHFLSDQWLQDGRVRDLFPTRIDYDLCKGESLWVQQFTSHDGWQVPPPTSSDLIYIWQMVQNEVPPEPLVEVCVV